jgi:hypothetical protein
MTSLIAVICALITDIASRVFLDATPAEGLIIYLVSFLAFRTVFKELKGESE